jgi:hypothetical protein
MMPLLSRCLIPKGHFAYSPRPVDDAFCYRALSTYGSPMSVPKTKWLLVNNAAPIDSSVRGTSIGLYRQSKTEKLVFQAIFAFQSARVLSLFEESCARGGRLMLNVLLSFAQFERERAHRDHSRSSLECRENTPCWTLARGLFHCRFRSSLFPTMNCRARDAELPCGR